MDFSYSKQEALFLQMIREFAEKEVKVEFDLLSEDSFGKLMASNEWTIGQVATLGEMITE